MPLSLCTCLEFQAYRLLSVREQYDDMLLVSSSAQPLKEPWIRSLDSTELKNYEIQTETDIIDIYDNMLYDVYVHVCSMYDKNSAF